MARIIINIILVIVLVLLTWFGLGPAFFADGTGTERFYTLLLVSFFYLLIFAIMFYVNKRKR
jgi:hypothetical protein